MKLKAIIIEDEPQACELLMQYIETYCSEVQLAGTATDANAGYELILKEQPNLLFLDIEIANDDAPETTFDLLARLPKYDYEVIFITAFDQYALRAIKCHALAYLLKPISIPELQEAVKLAHQRIRKEQQSEQLTDLIQSLQQPEKHPTRIWIPTNDELEAVFIEEIIRFEAADRYTYIFTNSKSRFLATKNLKEYINILEDSSFFHVHRSHFINTNYITKYSHKDGGLVIMKDGSNIPVARRRKQEFMDLLENL